MGCIIRMGFGWARDAYLWYVPWGFGTGGVDASY